MSTAQVKYINVSGERISEKNKKAYGITRESSLYKNITLFIFTFITLIFSVVILYGYLNIAQQNRIINTLNSEIRSLETERDDNNHNYNACGYNKFIKKKKLGMFLYRE